MSETNYRAPRAVPTLKCPYCGEMVELPAEICPECCYNFRTQLRDTTPDGRRRLFLLGGLVLAVLAFLAMTLLQPGKPVSNAPALPPTAAGVPDSEIGEALATLDTLADAPPQMDSRPFDELSDDPLIQQAKPILDKTNEVAADLEGFQETRDEVVEGEL